MTVAERLARFALAHRDGGLPEASLHEAKRLVLNQLKASVAAADEPVVRILADAAPPAGSDGTRAHMLWLGTETTTAAAAMVNGALFEVLDFSDTYIPTFMHAVSGVLPVVLAAGEQFRCTGLAALTALAVGIEVEIAAAEILMPTAYTERGFIPLGLVGGIGGAAAYAVLADLTEQQATHAIALAMVTAGGAYVAAGSMALSYVTAATARTALTVGALAAAGMTAPPAAFEGTKGMLQAYSNEAPARIEPVLAELGTRWRIAGQAMKTMPTETITHGPLECALALRDQAAGRELARLTVGVSPVVVQIADERQAQFGRPSSELEAKFDIRHCVCAAWTRGRFGLEEMTEAVYTDLAVLALRERVELVADPAQQTFDGAWAEATYTDGTTQRVDVPAFAGTVARPLTDHELTAVFHAAADGVLGPERAAQVADAVWQLDRAADLAILISRTVR